MRLPALLVLAAALLGLEAAAAADEPIAVETTEPVRVLLIGSPHFSNPGRDLNNVEADDVLAPARQAELEALTEALLAFEPTAVAVERTAEPPYNDPAFADVDERLRTDPGEDVQIGFRLARAAGLDRVYAIDESADEEELKQLPQGYFPYGAVAALAEETGRAGELNRLTDLSASTEAFEAAQVTETIPELLMRVNGLAHEDMLSNVEWQVVTFGEGERQPGPELAAFWFLRNAKIFNKLVQVTEPGDRVVVIYGAGHNPWLRELVWQTNGYELEPVMPYLERAARMAGER